MICKCGHRAREHKVDINLYSGYLKSFCNVTKPRTFFQILMGKPKLFVDDCNEFIPDNLKTVEYLARKKNLI